MIKLAFQVTKATKDNLINDAGWLDNHMEKDKIRFILHHYTWKLTSKYIIYLNEGSKYGTPEVIEKNT
jgi:autonomous glycyl radical cofactor GrcA